LSVLGNLLHYEFPVFTLKQHNAKVYVHVSNACNNIQSGKLKTKTKNPQPNQKTTPQKKLRGRKDKYFFIGEHRMLETEIFQKQVHSTKNVKTWENG